MGYVGWIGRKAKKNSVLVDLLLKQGAVVYCLTNVPQVRDNLCSTIGLELLYWLVHYSLLIGTHVWRNDQQLVRSNRHATQPWSIVWRIFRRRRGSHRYERFSSRCWLGHWRIDSVSFLILPRIRPSAVSNPSETFVTLIRPTDTPLSTTQYSRWIQRSVRLASFVSPHPLWRRDQQYGGIWSDQFGAWTDVDVCLGSKDLRQGRPRRRALAVRPERFASTLEWVAVQVGGAQWREETVLRNDVVGRAGHSYSPDHPRNEDYEGEIGGSRSHGYVVFPLPVVSYPSWAAFSSTVVDYTPPKADEGRQIVVSFRSSSVTEAKTNLRSARPRSSKLMEDETLLNLLLSPVNQTWTVSSLPTQKNCQPTNTGNSVSVANSSSLNNSMPGKPLPNSAGLVDPSTHSSLLSLLTLLSLTIRNNTSGNFPSTSTVLDSELC